MPKHLLASTIVLLLSLLPMSAVARDYGTVAGWQMAASGNSCGLYSSGAGTGEIVLLKNLSGQVHIQVTNEFWRNDDGSGINFAIDGRRWNGRFGIASAKTKNGVGYIAAFDRDIVPLLRKGRQLQVRRGAVTMGTYSLSGSAAALNRIEFCLNDLRNEGPAPVMTADAVAKRAITPPQPKNARGDWFRQSDYPSALQREGKEGTVFFRLTIDTRGRVKNCVVTRSSGHAELDNSSCKAATKRARFEPARNGEGKAVDASYDSKVAWRSPK